MKAKRKPALPMPPPDREFWVETAPGARICCHSYGQGEQTVILLHGNGEDYRCFARQIETLAKRFTLLTVDSRGHGASTRDIPMTLDLMADDLERVMQAAKIEQASIVGFSDGGNVALLFAMRHPQRVSKLVVAGANLFPAGLVPKLLRKLQMAWRFWNLSAHLSKRARAKRDLLALMVFEPQIAPESLAQIACPVLVMAGVWDDIAEAHTRLIARSLPDAHLRIIPSCGHFVFRDQASWVNETMLRFL